MNRFVTPSALPENVMLVDARPKAAYLQGHVSGALWIDLVSPTFTLRNDADFARFDATLETLIAEAGIEGPRVIVHDNGPEPRAARTAFLLEYAGLEVGILRGGFPALIAAGSQIVSGPNQVAPSTFKIHPQRALIATKDEVLAAGPAGRLLDARTRDEFSGRAAPPGMPRAGRAPGAQHFEWTRLMDANGFKSEAELERALSSLPDGEITVYCQSGARSSVLYHALRAQGRPARNYLPSMGEWLCDPSLPIETGEE